MSTKYKNIIFDLDGTLFDSAPIILETVRITVAELGLPEKTEAVYRGTIGLRLTDVPGKLWPESGVDGDTYARVYRSIFSSLQRDTQVGLFPGVEETLHLLHSRGYNLAIATSRSRRSLDEFLDVFGLKGLFSAVIGGDEVTNGKPSPEPVLTILDRCQWSAEDTLTVGDADVDILMGRGGGTATCGVSYGNGTREELESAGADTIIDSFTEILRLV